MLMSMHQIIDRASACAVPNLQVADKPLQCHIGHQTSVLAFWPQCRRRHSGYRAANCSGTWRSNGADGLSCEPVISRQQRRLTRPAASEYRLHARCSHSTAPGRSDTDAIRHLPPSAVHVYWLDPAEVTHGRCDAVSMHTDGHAAN